jgi:hypothetical protein
MAQSRNLSKPELVTLALYALGGASGPVDTEDIAVKADSIAPGTFGWRKYPDRVNLELVRVALVDASRVRGGAYVTGSGKGGWSLTKAGIEWNRVAGQRFLHPGDDAGVRPVTHVPEPWHVVSERSRIRALPAWLEWTAGADVDKLEAMRVFRIDQYTRASARRAKIARLSDLFGQDNEMRPFIERMAALVAI